MKEDSRIDSHKMMFHPEWVSRFKIALNDWEAAKTLYPLYMEITPTEACNHRCAFCALDYVGHRPIFLNKSAFDMTLLDMANGGVKAVMYAGEGEPTLHPQLAEIVGYTKELGIDVSLTTNGSAMNQKFLSRSLGYISWIKVSIDAGTKETYLKIHRPKSPRDWERVFANLETAVQLKRKHNYDCWVGAQALLLPETKDEKGNIIPGNIEEMIVLAEKLKAIGIDALVIKPYSHQPLSITKSYEKVVYDDYLRLENELRKIAASDFKIEFRSHTMEKYAEERLYDVCFATPFAWSYIMADGSVYSCSAYLLDKRFYLGNINEQSFKEIWEGEKRKKQWEEMKKFDPRVCRKNCRMDEVNRYLWEAMHPPYNANFI